MPVAERRIPRRTECTRPLTKRFEPVAPKSLAIAWNTARALPASNVLMGAGALALLAMLLGGRRRQRRIRIPRGAA